MKILYFKRKQNILKFRNLLLVRKCKFTMCFLSMHRKISYLSMYVQMMNKKLKDKAHGKTLKQFIVPVSSNMYYCTMKFVMLIIKKYRRNFSKDMKINKNLKDKNWKKICVTFN